CRVRLQERHINPESKWLIGRHRNGESSRPALRVKDVTKRRFTLPPMNLGIFRADKFQILPSDLSRPNMSGRDKWYPVVRIRWAHMRSIRSAEHRITELHALPAFWIRRRVAEEAEEDGLCE